MHDIDRTLTEFDSELDALEADEFEFDGEYEYESNNYEAELESPFDEIEEMELAAELLSLQSEEELDQFISGKLFKSLRKLGGKALSPLRHKLSQKLKTLVPVVGGALGSFIPIPGVGTAVGSALGSAVSKALETEFEGMDPEDQEFEMAKRFVRIAGTAAKQAAAARPDVDPQATAKAALVAAVRQHVPNLGNVTRNRASSKSPTGAYGGGRSGRWFRQGRKIVLLDV